MTAGIGHGEGNGVHSRLGVCVKWIGYRRGRAVAQVPGPPDQPLPVPGRTAVQKLNFTRLAGAVVGEGRNRRPGYYERHFRVGIALAQASGRVPHSRHSGVVLEAVDRGGEGIGKDLDGARRINRSHAAGHMGLAA